MGDESRRRRLRVCALAVGLLTLAAPMRSHVALASAAPLPEAPAAASLGAGLYEIVGRQSGLCLGVSGNSQSPDATVVQWTCGLGDNLRWRLELLADGYVRLTAGHSGLALAVFGGSQDDGAPVVQSTVSSAPEQQWSAVALADGYYDLIARHSGKLLNISGASTRLGEPAIQWHFSGADNEQFLLRRLDSGPQLSAADVTRFLEQSTWGPTPELVAHVQSVGFEAFLDEQFNAPASSYPTLPLYPTTRDNTACPSGSECQRDNYTIYPVQNRFFVNALYGEDQLRQRVAFALHQIIVVSNIDITQPSWMAPYLQVLDRNALGNYWQLLYDISLNPAMGNYLDIANNAKGNPNENYAREVLQLFSLGTVRLNPDGTQQLDATGQPIPTYTQTDVNNFARVFTGWRLATAPMAGVPNYIDPMVANQASHDVGAKTLLNGTVLLANQTASQDLRSAIDNIFADPNIGPFISKQLIQHLVTSNPTPGYVARVTAVFNGEAGSPRGDMKAVVRAILLDAEARGDAKTDPNYGRLKHPVQLITNLLRAFHARSADLSGPSDGYLNPQASTMGMDLFRPPSVFSYYSPNGGVPGAAGVRGPEFGLLSTSTALRRANFVNTMVFSRISVGTNAPAGTALDLAELQSLAASPTQLVQKLNTLLLHETMSAATRDTIVRAVTAVAASNPLKRARTALYLVASASQYQVEK